MVIQEDLLITFGADIIQLQKSQLLFEENNSPTYYFQIKTGKIKLTNFQTENREFIQSIHGDGDSIGEIFLFSKYKYPVNAVLMEDCTIFRLEHSQLLKLLASDFEIQMKFLHYLAERSYHSCIFLNSLTSEDATHQLLTVLNHLKGSQNKERYSYKIPYTRKELAFLTGLRIETVIRTFKKMENESLIKIVKGRVYY
ncbi:Crp/Fnr family transcriptional regulator [Chryseobacterium indoltheticum]|uniref:DNA-binding transcriptional dual regulator Crp n=1 Tax=Chryseobacterium indoltheticum TaxID=254 RepID=A0A381FC86_9FLAO|nr:Crp/Fnr family transcriptional regulator [Chryseobacterium indoltheticum]SUX44186.1 DNA-binding transcriptional dual regulator Crp [Chryseobacterium indoltheticum]